MRIAPAFECLLVLCGACARPTCPAGDTECLANAFSIVDFEHFDDPSRREVLTQVESSVLAALPPADGAVRIDMIIGTPLVFDAPDDGALMQMLWTDDLGCRPAFCFSHCPRGARCFAPSRCTPARDDHTASASTLHWVEYASTPAQTTEMDLSIVPVSAARCSTDLATLLAEGVAGPPVTVTVRLPGADDGGGGNGGPCGDGIQASTLNCTPIGSGGAADRCISRAEYEGATGLPLPAQCAAKGTTGCMDTQRGVIVKPCCPNLTCAVGSVCGGGSTFGGECI